MLHYRRWPEVEKTLERLLRQVPADDVVVVDNASGDGSAELIEDRFPGLRVVVSEANAGYAAGMNLGLRLLEARGYDCVLLLTHECLLDDGAVRHLRRELEDGSVGAAAPALGIRSRPETVWSAGGEFAPRSGRPCHTGADARFDALPGEPSDTAWVDGAALLVRTAALAGIGGLDERFFLYYEDVDLGLRLRAAGWRVVVVPKARAWQEPSGVPPYLDARNRVVLWRKHGRRRQVARSVIDVAWAQLRDLRHGRPGLRRARARATGLRHGLTGALDRSLAQLR